MADSNRKTPGKQKEKRKAKQGYIKLPVFLCHFIIVMEVVPINYLGAALAASMLFSGGAEKKISYMEALRRNPMRPSSVIYGKIPKQMYFSESINRLLWSGLESESSSIDISSLKMPLDSFMGAKGTSLVSGVTYYQMVNLGRYWFSSGTKVSASYDDTLPKNQQVMLDMYPHSQHLNDGAFNAQVERICAKAMKKKTIKAKVTSVNNSICQITSYGEGDHSSDAYGALINRKAVCTGYAQAFYLCMRRLFIPVKYEYNKECDHIWNRVLVDGKWKVVDVTWNDSAPKNQYLLTPKHKAAIVFDA